MVKLENTTGLSPVEPYGSCEFDSRYPHPHLEIKEEHRYPYEQIGKAGWLRPSGKHKKRSQFESG